jgi:UDP-3-O-[3-hydroxymyristoyl] N-acetylglucosamine deacetylase
MVEKTSQAAVAQPDAAIASQATLAQGFEQRGVGLHSGLETWVRVEPAPVDTGRVFVRTDLPEAPVIPATLAQVGQTLLSTELAVGEATIRTVEHLLAALIGHGVDNAQILVNGPEIPLLDGSAQPWSAAIAAAGIQPQAAPRAIYSVTAPVHIQSGDAFVMAMPAPEPRLTYGIDFEVTAIGNQWYSWSPVTDDFATLVAPARTFGLAYQVEYLRSQGLIKGGSLDNALVCDHDGWVNPPLRFENEPARHKLLDLLGDLSLLGALPQAHVVAYKASHQLHGQLAQAIAQQQNSG